MKGTEFTTSTLPKIVSESGVFDMMISQKHWQVFTRFGFLNILSVVFHICFKSAPNKQSKHLDGD